MSHLPELRNSQATLYHSVFASLPAGICVVDCEGRIIDVNPALERLLGSRLSERRGQQLSPCLQQSIRDPVQALSWTVALSEALIHHRMTYLNLPVDIRTGTDDRDTVSVLGVMAPWWVPGAEQSGAMVIFHDAALHTSLEGSRTRFLSVVSHELGSPVTSISAAADRLAKRLDTADLEQWRLLEIIRSEAARVRRLLGQFLSTSPARAESLRPARSVVTLPLLIRRAAHMLRLRDTRHQIVVHLPNDLPFVWGDADSVQQVLSNLADNAIKYSAPGTLITLSATARKDDVLASVTDQGQGVAPGNEERIFEPAYRFCQDGQEIEGQGLGLAMARALIEAQGGELWYRRHPPGGACFCFTLPRVEDLPDEEGDADHGNHNPDR